MTYCILNGICFATAAKSLAIGRRRDALRSFYRNVVGSLWKHPSTKEDDSSNYKFIISTVYYMGKAR